KAENGPIWPPMGTRPWWTIAINWAWPSSIGWTNWIPWSREGMTIWWSSNLRPGEWTIIFWEPGNKKRTVWPIRPISLLTWMKNLYVWTKKAVWNETLDTNDRGFGPDAPCPGVQGERQEERGRCGSIPVGSPGTQMVREDDALGNAS